MTDDAQVTDTEISTKTAVVLGPGGRLGTAWLLGLIHGLRVTGVDLAAVDLIVGTSAGAIAAAAMTSGRDLAELAELPQPDGRPQAKGVERIKEVFEILGEPAADHAERLRRVGRLATAVEPYDEDEHLRQMAYLTEAQDWPTMSLLIPTIGIETGEARIWTHRDEAPLLAVVAAGCAFPGAAPPVAVLGSRYIDGALRGGSNADLAEGAQVRLIIEPMVPMSPAADAQTGDGRSGEARTGAEMRIGPDARAIEVLGGPDDADTWSRSYEAGAAQAPGSAERIAELLAM